MEKLITISSSAVPLPIENIDTDQIIPARFLKAITKDDFGQNLFRDWRYSKNEELIEDFVLNSTIYSGSILLAGRNFGCGSSREHAAWALYDYGFRVIISSFFADIFKANALNNGILPVTIPDDKLDALFTMVTQNPDQQIEVSVEDQVFKCGDLEHHFELDAYKKQCLLEGLDDIDYLLKQKDAIEQYEKTNTLYQLQIRDAQ